jgi:hypothetical protein
MLATIGAVITVAATTTREPQSGLGSWVLRLGLPPLDRVTTVRVTDIMDRHTATMEIPIGTDAVTILHIEIEFTPPLIRYQRAGDSKDERGRQPKAAFFTFVKSANGDCARTTLTATPRMSCSASDDHRDAAKPARAPADH